MKDFIRERALEEANYIVNTGNTIRKTAEHFKVSKSTVHNDVSHRLPHINYLEYSKVRKVLDFNKKIRHFRGGLATREKYKGTINM